MKKIVVILILVSVNLAHAQQFTEKFSIVLPDSIMAAQTEWVDLDNDGLLDVLILSRNQRGESYLSFVRGDTLAIPTLQSGSTSIIDYQHYSVVDYDRDNSMDVLVSGLFNNQPTTAVYLNRGDFTFDETILSVPAFSISKFVDLDDDAKVEWILSGQNGGDKYVNIYTEQNQGQWKLVHDSLKFSLTSLEIFDVDGDGTQDIFISGSMGLDSLFTGFLINEGKFYFKQFLKNSWIGSSSIADLNEDGVFDVLFTGRDNNGNSVTKIFESQGRGFEIKNGSIPLEEPSIFVADLNSDGMVDYSFYGKSSSNDSLNIIRYGAFDYDTLRSHQVLSQRFGDLEHDGDLDLVQVIDERSIRLRVLENTAAENIAPPKPSRAIALQLFNRMFMYWDKPEDDHTPVPSITFDLMFLSPGNELQSGEFDLLENRRLNVSHGNNRTQNFRLIKIPTAAFSFAIQAVDNSLHAGRTCNGPGCLPCTASLETEKLSMCDKEQISLTAPSESLWFSFADGYLGAKTAFDFKASKQDTVFYFNPSAEGCGALKVWSVGIQNDTIKKEVSSRYACEGSVLALTVEPGWDNISWTSEQKGNLGSSANIQYSLTQNDSVFVTISSSETGCVIIRKTAMLISKPEVEVRADRYKIMKGSEVQLTATGAVRYTWLPAAGLSQADIANPIATPVVTTEYKVTGYDSLECSDQATVVIVVEESGFIPNLFTPNDDGTNDELKIYGLLSVRDFSLTIYNREGSLVFKSTNISEVSQLGWNGTTNGIKQPGGVYFWKVKGTLNSGDKLLLNGKDSGSIVLVR